MTWKGWISALGLCVLGATWTGCETDHAARQYVCTSDDIRTGDTLKISLLDIPEPLQDKEFVVRSDGAINLPFLGSVPAAGKKFGDFEREVQNAYIEKKIFRQVTVVVKVGDRFYSVDGEVKSPDRKLYIGDTTVIRAIAVAADSTSMPIAAKSKSFVRRGN